MCKLLSAKAIRLLQGIFALKKLNKILLPLNDEYDVKDDPFHCFAIIDYYPLVYEDSIALMLELAVTARREIEKYGSVQTRVKYPNIGKYCDRNEDISFEKSLSKIIHAKTIRLQTKSDDGQVSYGYDGNRNSAFTGFALISGDEQDGTLYKATIDIIRMCVDIVMMDALSSY